MYKIELRIDDDLDDDVQAETLLEVGTVIDVGDGSGVGVVGRIVTVHITRESLDAV